MSSTDPAAAPAQLLERYAKRWTIEMCFHDAKSTCGAGQARNRTPKAVARTVPFGLLRQTIAVTMHNTTIGAAIASLAAPCTICVHRASRLAAGAPNVALCM